MIPTESVVPELGGKKVYVYRNGKAQPVTIETGLRQDADIQVISGLQEGDTLITTGVLQIKPGADVTITSMQ
jgi:membrane fusion protein (multidrug efflux system)